LGEEKKKPGKEISAEFAESAEGAEKSKGRSGMGIKIGELAALDRKSPPFAGLCEGWGTLKYALLVA